MKSSLGIYPIYNMQYYKTKEAQLSSKLATLRSQLAYSSGTDRVYLEKQIKQVEEEYQDCLTAIKLVEKQEEIDEMEYLLDQMEYAAGPYYEQLVEELKQKYGK